MDLSKILKDSLPALATAVAGPAGGIVVSAISQALNIPAPDLESSLTANPELLKRLADMDAQLKKHNDVESARAREIAIAQSDSKLAKATAPILALATVGLTFVMCAVLIFWPIASAQQQICIFILGFISSGATQVLSYYFGGSNDAPDPKKWLKP